MYVTYIVMLPVGKGDRTALEHIENEKFDSVEAVRKLLSEECNMSIDEVDMCPLTDFMDFCNDQDIKIENVWIGYVRIKSDKQPRYYTLVEPRDKQIGVIRIDDIKETKKVAARIKAACQPHFDETVELNIDSFNDSLPFLDKSPSVSLKIDLPDSDSCRVINFSETWIYGADE